MINPTTTLFRTARFIRPATRAYTITATRAASTGGGNLVSDKGTQQGTSTTSGKETGGSRDHALDKGNDGDSNIQSQTSKAGREYATPFPPPIRNPFTLRPDRDILATRGLGLRTGSEAFLRENDDGVVWEATYADLSRSAKANDEGGSATQGKDTQNSTAKAKKDHPEAPDVVIGMQDERGGKGA